MMECSLIMNFIWPGRFQEREKENDMSTTTTNLTMCPTCGGRLTCYSRDVGGSSKVDEYALVCPKDGLIDASMVNDVENFSGADFENNPTRCPFCGKSPGDHEQTPSEFWGGVDRLLQKDGHTKWSRIRAIFEKHWPGLPGDWGMVLDVCESSAPDDVTEEELVSKAKQIGFEFKASMPWDDDVYWLTQSPFNGRWYTFAQSFCSGGGYPSRHVYDDAERPARFDEE